MAMLNVDRDGTLCLFSSPLSQMPSHQVKAFNTFRTHSSTTVVHHNPHALDRFIHLPAYEFDFHYVSICHAPFPQRPQLLHPNSPPTMLPIPLLPSRRFQLLHGPLRRRTGAHPSLRKQRPIVLLLLTHPPAVPPPVVYTPKSTRRTPPPPNIDCHPPTNHASRNRCLRSQGPHGFRRNRGRKKLNGWIHALFRREGCRGPAVWVIKD